MLVVGAIHAVVVAIALVVLDQVRDEGLMSGLTGDLDTTDKQANDAPGERLDVFPAGSENAEGGPAKDDVAKVHVHLPLEE
jgi:hypothetical protein